MMYQFLCRLNKEFEKKYNELYENEHVPFYEEFLRQYNENFQHNLYLINKFNEHRGDVISSDREGAAFMFALYKLSDRYRPYTEEEMHEYGYLWDEMSPLNKMEAIYLDAVGNRIYKLFDDDTEAEVEGFQEIFEWDGMFGIEKHVS